MDNPTISILGRPNVGKSTLFNRLVGSRKSIVSPVEGVTRDRIYSTFDWVGHNFNLIDTGGFIPRENDVMNQHIREQARIAIDDSDLIIFVVDGQSDITSSDRILSDMVKRSQRECVLVVNKIDSQDSEVQINYFFELGLGEPIAISATHGRNIGNMLDMVLEKLPKNKQKIKDINVDLSLAIVGMPNVGKSSLMNALLNEQKSIVTDIPGTTRDSVDSYINYFGKTIRLIDTAGLRKKSKVRDEIEFYSGVRTNKVILECDVSVLMIDGSKGFDKQDKDMINSILKLGKGLIIAVNKWDLIEKKTNTMNEYVKDIEYSYRSMQSFPIIFISVKHNLRLSTVLDNAVKVYSRLTSKVSTPLLNELVQKIISENPPPAVKGKYLKIKYAAQPRHSPPIFAIFMNHPNLVPLSYKRYIENRLRRDLDLEGVPIKISFRKK